MKLSIIVPCYNVAPFLERGLLSLVNQTLTDIEIICIDDKSTDNTLAILHEWARSDLRIRVVENDKNMGVGYTRNRGIDLAQGDFVGFMDPDDWVEPQFYKRLVKEAEKTLTPVVCGVVVGHPVARSPRVRYLPLHKSLHYFRSHYSAVYLRDFLNRYNLHFPHLSVGEDTVFEANVKCRMQKPIRCVRSVAYHYVRRFESLDSEIWTTKKLTDFTEALRQVVNVYNMSDDITRQDYIIGVHGLFDYLLDQVFYIKALSIGQEQVATAACEIFRYMRYPDELYRKNKPLCLALQNDDVAGVCSVLKNRQVFVRDFMLFGWLRVASLEYSMVERNLYVLGIKVWGSHIM